MASQEGSRKDYSRVLRVSRGGSDALPLPDPLPEAMIRAREDKALSQRKLGEMVGCSGVFISKIESGQKSPKANLLAKIQEVLQLDNEIIQQHVYTRPYTFITRSSAKGLPEIRAWGRSDDEMSDREKAIQLMLAAAAALRSSGYHAEPYLPNRDAISKGAIPWIEVALGDDSVGIIEIEVKEKNRKS